MHGGDLIVRYLESDLCTVEEDNPKSPIAFVLAKMFLPINQPLGENVISSLFTT